MDTTRQLSLIIADDHAVVREGITAFLKSRLNVHLLAECSSGEEAAREIIEQRPDLAILDLHLPQLSCLEVIRRVREAGGSTRIIVLSVDRNDSVTAGVLESGASAYLLKEGAAPELLEAISTSLAGGQYLSPALQQRKASEAENDLDPLVLLSRREYEVFALLVQGIRPRDVARQLEISPKTVDTYRANILRKLEVEGIAGLVRFAIQRSSAPPIPGGRHFP